MADKTKNLEPEPENGNGENGETLDVQDTQTVEAIKKYVKDKLNTQIENAASEQKIGCLDFQAEVNASKVKICRILENQSVHREYFGIHNCVSTNLSIHAGKIKANVATYTDTKKEIDTALNGTLDALKAFKQKLRMVKDAACNLDAARTDSCNSEQLKAINNNKFGEITVTNAEGEKKISKLERFNYETDAIVQKAGELFEKSSLLFDKGVKVAGILAFMNIESLVELAGKMETDANAVKAGVEANLSLLKSKSDECQSAYTEELSKIGAAYFNRNAARRSYKVLRDMKNKLEKEKGEESLSTFDCTGYDQDQRLKDICAAVEKNVDDIIICDEDTGTAEGRFAKPDQSTNKNQY